MKLPGYSLLNFRNLWALVLLLGATVVGAQAQTWQTAFANDNSSPTATAVDASGNVYVTGTFGGTAVFGSISLTSSGSSDVFVAKWSPVTQSFVWAQKAGGVQPGWPTALAVNGTSVYIAGTFKGSATFGDFSVAGGVNGDGFVAKLTDTGAAASFTWVQRLGGNEADEATALAVSGSSVYVAGTFSSAATFGPLLLLSAGATDGFVAKLTDAGSSGTFVWARAVGGTDADKATAVGVNGVNVYLTGAFEGDAAVSKFTDAGSTSTPGWTQKIIGPGIKAMAMAVNGSSIYLTGQYYNVATIGDTKLTGGSGDDLFLARLIDAGDAAQVGWMQRADQSLSYDTGTAIAVSGSSVYVTGSFSSVSTFGTTTLRANEMDIFVAKLTDEGRFVWAQQAGGTSYANMGTSIAVHGTQVYITGFTTFPATFGTLTLGEGVAPPTQGHESNGPKPMRFFASLSDATLTPTTRAQPGVAFTLAPNPAHGTTTVRVPAVPGATTATLTLLDALGRAVRTYTGALPASGLRQELNVTGLPVGLYALRVTAGAVNTTQRLVID